MEMMMTNSKVKVARLDGFLACMASLNRGCDHVCTYEFCELGLSEFPEEALRQHLSLAHEEQGAARWDIALVEAEDAEAELYRIARYYFFELSYSPQADDADNVVAAFLDLLHETLGSRQYRLFRADVRAHGIWYESMWDDYLLQVGARRFFLHFGVTD